ncbi:K02A2.6-like, partial [Cordylochernes scorpioides]
MTTNIETLVQEYEHFFHGLGTIKGYSHKVALKDNYKPIAQRCRRISYAMVEAVNQELDKMLENGIIEEVHQGSEWVSNIIVVPKRDSEEIRLYIDLREVNKAILRERHPFPTIDNMLHALKGAKELDVFLSLMVIFARHGYPTEVVTDNSLQFVSTSMERFSKECGIRHIKASPYYPKRIEKIEKFHRFLKKQFNSSSEEGKDWKEDLSRILMSYRTTPNRSTGKTPAFLLFSREIKTKLSSLVNDAEEDESNIKEFNMVYKEKLKTYNDINRKASPHNFEIGNLVYVANPNNGKLDSNFRSEHHAILENTLINSIKLVNTKNGKIIHRNAKHLKHVPTQETNQDISHLIPEESQENLNCEHINQKPLLSTKTIEDLNLVTKHDAVYHLANSSCSRAESIINKYEDVLKGLGVLPKEYHIEIEKEATPVQQHPRRIPIDEILPSLNNAKIITVIDAKDGFWQVKLDSQSSDLTTFWTPFSRYKWLRMPFGISATPEEIQRRLHEVIEGLEGVEVIADDILVFVPVNLIRKGSPKSKYKVPREVMEYWKFRDELTEQDGIIYKGQKVMIPKTLRSELLNRVHASHHGVAASLAKARQAIFWPWMNQSIKETVEKCKACLAYQPNQTKETLMCHETPNLPWNKIGMDIFSVETTQYLITVDYYSSFWELDILEHTTSESIIKCCKKNFSLHGIPETLITDNGPQFISREFQKFLRTWKVVQITSSPYHRQSNGKAESAVKSAKMLVKKAKHEQEDLWLAILEWRNTPLKDLGFSPNQALISRRTQTLIPIHKNLLKPEVQLNVYEKIEKRKTEMKNLYDKQARDFTKLNPGQSISVKLKEKDKWRMGKCISAQDPRSYIVEVEGHGYRRNRRDIRTLPSGLNLNEEYTDQNPQGEDFEPNKNKVDPICESSSSMEAPRSTDSGPRRTRSGRPIRTPSRYSDYRMPGHRKRRQFKQTDAFTRGMVIGLKRAGWSIPQIAADTHLGASTVHRMWRRWLEQGNVAIYRNAGATRVTSARVDRRILRQAVAAPQATCTAILKHVQDTLDHSISTRTISRRLVANDLHSCRPLRRLPFTPPNRRQRLEWCRARSTWMTEWHRVVFSDDSRFCLSSDSRRVRVWRRRGERSNPAAIVERPTVRQRGIMGVPNALYQQDNARPHTARISQQALQDVQMLPWPPYSPDLSPIEQVWDIIGRRLHTLPQPRSEDELWQMVEREWRAIPQDAIHTLIDSLPRRVAACIAVR